MASNLSLEREERLPEVQVMKQRRFCFKRVSEGLSYTENITLNLEMTEAKGHTHPEASRAGPDRRPAAGRGPLTLKSAASCCAWYPCLAACFQGMRKRVLPASSQRNPA